MKETMGKRIAAFRKEKGMTQEELAERMGISAQQTHAYITSRTLNFGGTSHETTDFL